MYKFFNSSKIYNTQYQLREISPQYQLCILVTTCSSYINYSIIYIIYEASYIKAVHNVHTHTCIISTCKKIKNYFSLLYFCCISFKMCTHTFYMWCKIKPTHHCIELVNRSCTHFVILITPHFCFSYSVFILVRLLFFSIVF